MRKLFLFIMLLVMVSCQSPVAETLTEMEFAVDSLLVDRQVNDTALNISYGVPSKWTIVENTPVKSLAGIKISHLFINSDSSVMFSTTDIRSMPDSSLREIHDNYNVVLNPDGKWGKIDAADFIKDNFRVRQYVMKRQDLANFKMFFSKNSRYLFQLDYLVKMDSLYETNTKILESILGTLRSIN